MASLTRWTWVWVNSGSWWWTGMPGVLRFMGSQRVRHDWATELNWCWQWHLWYLYHRQYSTIWSVLFSTIWTATQPNNKTHNPSLFRPEELLWIKQSAISLKAEFNVYTVCHYHLAPLWLLKVLLLFSGSVVSYSSVAPGNVAHWAPLSMGFPRQQYGVGYHFLFQGIFLTQGSNPCLLHWQAGFYHWVTWKACWK